ncbi:MAG: hypothetical protein O3A36_02375 [bacterium]|nr:hypothetical protein [bacterium]
MKLVLTIAIGSILLVSGGVQTAWAAGTVSGTLKGSGGTTAAVSYTFTNGSTSVTGTTYASGVFSQSLDDGTWSFTATPASSFTYASNISLSSIVVDSGDSFNFGTIYFPFEVPAGSADDLQNAFGALPAECSLSGTPKIIRAYYTDETKGEFLYGGNSAAITVVANAAGFTVTGDYSILEGNQIGTNSVAATDNGDGTYTISHTLANTAMGGGFALIQVTSGGSTTSTCLDGPINMDIRSHFTGADTTIFSQVSNFRAMTNFTMHQDGIVKVKFTKALNMLDRTVQLFMMRIADKMVSETAKLDLDAKAVQEIRNAGAEITFYNVPDYGSDKPTILLDGEDPGSIVSDIVYSREAKTLTFTGGHFSEYTVVPKITVSSPEDSTVRTTDSTYTVKGSVDAVDTEINVYLNGKNVFTAKPIDKKFEIKVDLKIGENIIEVKAANGVGSALPIKRKITRLPGISISSPADGSQTANDTIAIAGRVNDTKSSVQILVNNVNQGTIVLDKDGNFSHPVSLKDGNNSIEVRASNDYGSALNVKRTVERVLGTTTASNEVVAETPTLPSTGVPLHASGILLLCIFAGYWVSRSSRLA